MATVVSVDVGLPRPLGGRAWSRALLTEPALLPRLLAIDGLEDRVRVRAGAAADTVETSRHPGPVAHLIARDLGYGPITPSIDEK